MPKKRADYIREELAKDFEASAQEIANRLQKRGITIDPQHVYQVSSDLRKQQQERLARQRQGAVTRAENELTLSEHIVQALLDAPDGLTDQQILGAVTGAGYKTRSADFLDTLRKKLYELVERGRLQKSGSPGVYSLSEAERRARQSAQPVPGNNGEIVIQQPQAATLSPTVEQPVQAASPALATAPERQNVLLDQDLLFECLALCRKAGGVDALSPYLDSIRKLQS
jgi:hypothetical protein